MCSCKDSILSYFRILDLCEKIYSKSLLSSKNNICSKRHNIITQAL